MNQHSQYTAACFFYLKLTRAGCFYPRIIDLLYIIGYWNVALFSLGICCNSKRVPCFQLKPYYCNCMNISSDHLEAQINFVHIYSICNIWYKHTLSLISLGTDITGMYLPLQFVTRAASHHNALTWHMLHHSLTHSWNKKTPINKCFHCR